MASEDRNGGPAGFGVAASAIECAVNAVNAASKNMQAVAGECFEISRESFERATQAWEQLRGAHGMDDVIKIQTTYMRAALENASQHVRKLGELAVAFPAEIAKAYQDAWLKSVNAGVEAVESAGKTASETVTSFPEAARKAAPVYDRHDSAKGITSQSG